jgi:hypothetical protein
MSERRAKRSGCTSDVFVREEASDRDWSAAQVQIVGKPLGAEIATGYRDRSDVGTALW